MRTIVPADTDRDLEEHRAVDAEQSTALHQAMYLSETTARGRLRWLIEDVIFADLTGLTVEQRFALWLKIQGVVLAATDGKWSLVAPPWKELERVGLARASRAQRELLNARRRKQGRKAEAGLSSGILNLSSVELLNAQGPLRGVVIGLSDNRGVRFDLGEVEAFGAPDGSMIFFAPLASGLYVSLVALLEDVAPRRLVRCAFRGAVGGQPAVAGDRCWKVFLPRKRQRWCPEHKKVVRKQQFQEAQRSYRKRHARRKGAGRATK